MIGNILDEIVTRKNFYRNYFRRMVMMLAICLVLIFILIGIILYVFFSRPEPAYYATSYSGEILQLLAVPKGTGLKFIPGA